MALSRDTYCEQPYLVKPDEDELFVIEWPTWLVARGLSFGIMTSWVRHATGPPSLSAWRRNQTIRVLEKRLACWNNEKHFSRGIGKIMRRE